MVLPIIWANVSEGIRNTDRQLLEMGRMFRFGPWKTAWRIFVPSILPYFMAGCTTGLGLAWKAGVAAEVLAMPRNSIGLQLYNAKVYLETSDLFAWTLVIILLSMLLEKPPGRTDAPPQHTPAALRAEARRRETLMNLEVCHLKKALRGGRPCWRIFPSRCPLRALLRFAAPPAAEKPPSCG